MTTTQLPSADLTTVLHSILPPHPGLLETVLAAVRPYMAPGPPNPRAAKAMPRRLSAREAQVLACIAQGMTNGAIGSALSLSVDTVKTHNQRLFKLLDARDRAHAVARAYQLGLITLPTQPAGVRR